MGEKHSLGERHHTSNLILEASMSPWAYDMSPPEGAHEGIHHNKQLRPETLSTRLSGEDPVRTSAWPEKPQRA